MANLEKLKSTEYQLKLKLKTLEAEIAILNKRLFIVGREIDKNTGVKNCGGIGNYDAIKK
jgi:hypothetical protein